MTQEEILFNAMVNLLVAQKTVEKAQREFDDALMKADSVACSKMNDASIAAMEAGVKEM